MVELHLSWSRDHLIDFYKQITNNLLNDSVSDSFDVTLRFEKCNISINESEVIE